MLSLCTLQKPSSSKVTCIREDGEVCQSCCSANKRKLFLPYYLFSLHLYPLLCLRLYLYKALNEMTRTGSDHQTTGTDTVYSWSLGITQQGNFYSVDSYQVAVDSVVLTHFFPLVLSISCWACLRLLWLLGLLVSRNIPSLISRIRETLLDQLKLFYQSL